MFWNRNSLFNLAFGVLLALPAVNAQAVDRNVPGSYGTIQEAINASSDGDVAILTDGIYTGAGNKDLDFGGRLIAVRAQSDDPALCVIDCEGSGRGFYFHTSGLSAATVRGITIRNGHAGTTLGGGAILSNNSSPSLVRCVFENNEDRYGAAIFAGGTGSPSIINSTFRSNYASIGGGGIFCSAFVTTRVTGCTFVDNGAGSYGGALANNSQPQSIVTNCTFSGNSAPTAGAIANLNAGSTIVRNCVLWGNPGGEIANWQGGWSDVGYSIVQGGWSGTGNMNTDPGFVNAAAGDVRLLTGSPCLDAGLNSALPADSVDLDADGDAVEALPNDLAGNERVQNGTVDLGAYEGVFVPNSAPTLTVPSSVEATVGLQTSFHATATDPEGDVIQYSLLGAPAWASIDSTTGLVTLNPTSGSAGALNLTVKATDAHGASDTKSVTVTVSALSIENVTAVRRDGKMIIVTLTLRNAGTAAAVTNVSITGGTLAGAQTITSLPLTYSTIKAGAVKSVNIQFKNIAAGPATLVITGSSSAGPVGGTRIIAVP